MPGAQALAKASSMPVLPPGWPCIARKEPGARWTLRTVAAILANPRYTGRQVWNRQRTDFDLADPGNTGLGHKQVQRWNLSEGWIISKRPAHPARALGS
jgi:recombinase